MAVNEISPPSYYGYCISIVTASWTMKGAFGAKCGWGEISPIANKFRNVKWDP